MNETIIIAILSSGALGVLISKIFDVFLTRKGSLRKQLERLEKDSLRTQLLVMISDYPTEKQEILTLGDRYFRQLKGDWYMTSLYNKWLEKTGTTPPTWFHREG